MPHHILHLLPTSDVHGTGMTRIVAALADHLDPEKYKLEVWFRCGHGPLIALLEKKGIIVRVLDWSGGERNPFGLCRFLRGHLSRNFSILHEHVGGRAVRWISRYAGGAKIITQLHGRGIESSDGMILARPSLTGADCVIATSRNVAEWSGVNAQVVYPGVDLPLHTALHKKSRPGFILGVAGRVVPIKGIKFLIRALAIVKTSLSDVSLEIAGSGHEEAELHFEVQKHGLADSVKFLGWCENVPYERWDVFVMPSLEESFGIAALEAMAWSLPIVGSRVGGLTELVISGKTGWLTPPADPTTLAERIVSLLSNTQQRRTMGLAARERAALFDTKKMCKSIEKIYQTLLADKNSCN